MPRTTSWQTQSHQLRDTKTGLDCNCEKGMVTAACPGLLVGRRQQCPNLWTGQKHHQAARKPLTRNRQDSLNKRASVWLLKGHIAEKGVDCGKPKVTSPRTIFASFLKLVEESYNEWRIQIVEIQARWRLLERQLGILEKQLETISVGSNCVRAHLTLAHEPIGEEGFKQCSQIATCFHGSLPRPRSSRAPATARSSGAAERYQYVSATCVWPR